ncbi:hypothetical protein [Staphylococcus ratti]|uniref:Uncharacterized protein n=1 Tax=Staphylococcus ratti TaxID=2892440 RepID=A0ABY3PF15_9STAP|nr:hypothetical protein [Staphylococcus ratti]UEX90884.1 hypothetical protein LN051_04510 [Staphylococcus ratti]
MAKVNSILVKLMKEKGMQMPVLSFINLCETWLEMKELNFVSPLKIFIAMRSNEIGER